MMDRTLGFIEDSRAATEIGSVYGKLRRAELQRNFWTFAIKTVILRAVDTTTMFLQAALWSEVATYFVGSIVSDDRGAYWFSNTPSNVGNDPQNTVAWEPYFGPLSVSVYDDDTAYFAGELVYTAAGDGTYRVYLSLESDNEDDPATATAWVSTDTYNANQVVTRTAIAYMSLIDLNTGNDPALAPALWGAGTTYGIGAAVGGSDGVIYTSVVGANLAIDPVSDDGTHWTNTGVLNPWTTMFTAGAGSIKWLQIGGAEFPSGVALSVPRFMYPIGSGPSSQSATRNVFKLPANYLRTAPQDPKTGAFSYLGAPSGRPYDDWLIESGYLISGDAGPIRLRFVADVADVRLMNDMFCEGLGARIAFEVCQSVTQSTSLKSTIAQTYQKFMTEARQVNAIEAGWVEPPEDEYISVRR